jgi:hypothetical protein
LPHAREEIWEDDGLGDETPTVRSPHKWRPMCWEDIEDEGHGVKDLCTKEVLEVKICTPNEAIEPCHGSGRRSQSRKMKTSGRLMHLRLEASGIRTCIG